MVLDRKIGIMLRMMKTHETPIYNMDVKDARLLMESKHRGRSIMEEVGSQTDYSIDTKNGPIRVRAYQPLKVKKKGLCYLYYHGGGAVLFTIEDYESVCRHLCNESGAIVISVDYHLAPEFQFPVQIEDAMAAYLWVLSNHNVLNIDYDKVVVIGDSFGGYLATEICLESKKQSCPCPLAQILLYPRTDYHRVDLESYKLYSEGYNLDSEEMKWYWDAYLPRDCSYDDSRVCPNRSKDLSGLPRAYIFTAECDSLRDEGEEYASRLIKNNVPVKIVRVDGQIHGFIHFWDVLDTPREILDAISRLPEVD